MSGAVPPPSRAPAPEPAPTRPRVWITGAGGFIGAGLVDRLLADAAGASPAQPAPALTLIDRHIAPARLAAWRQQAPDLQVCLGDFAHPALLARARQAPPHTLFHLASLPGGEAERRYTLGYQVNLAATLALAQAVADAPQDGAPPVLVFASSIAVLGDLGPMDGRVDEDARPCPQMSYGAHKWMAEIGLADLARRGRVDVRSLRLPGVVARPPVAGGHGSAFMSQVFHARRAGQTFHSPVGPQATGWWMSLDTVVDNLCRAAAWSPAQAAQAPGRVWQLPVLRATVAEVLAALDQALAVRRLAAAPHPDPGDARPSACWQPDARLEALFGRMPNLCAPRAEVAGLRADADLAHLVATVLARLDAAA